MRQISFTELVAGRVPDDLTGVRWPDGTVECRFNVTAEDYPVRVRAAGHADPGVGEVLTDPATECDRCAERCG